MTGGASGVETYAKSICLLHNISTSDFKKALGRTQNSAGTTCLRKFKEPLQIMDDIALTWVSTPLAPPVMNIFLYNEDGQVKNGRRTAVSERHLYHIQPPASSPKVSCFKISCLKVSCFKVSCFKVSCLKVSFIKVSSISHPASSLQSQGIMFQGIMSQGIMSQCIMSLGVTYEGILSQVITLHYFTTLSALALPFLPLLYALTFCTHPLPSSLSLALGPCNLYPDHYFSCPFTPALSPLCFGPLCPKLLCPQSL